MLGGRGEFRVRASKGIHLVVPAEPDHLHHRADHPDREESAVRHPVGPALDHRHHRHRLGPRPRPPRRQRAPTSTTCSTTSTGSSPTAHPRRRRRGVRGTAAAAGRRVRLHLQAVPRARRRLPGAGADRRRRRQVHDVPGDGRRRRRRAVRELPAPRDIGSGVRDAFVHRRTCRCWGPRATTGCGTPVPDWPASPGSAHRAGRAPARPLRLADRRAVRADRRPARARPAAGRRHRSTWRSRRCTPPPTRARCTWTTSSPGGPGSRSRPGTAAWPPRRRSPSWSRRCSAGTPARSLARSSTTAPGSPPSGRVQHQPDDLSADAARLGAPDVRMDGRG